MKILIATPLYPPDTAPTARYVKELARRLSESYTVTVLTYGRLPEQIQGVRIIEIDKRRPLPVRLFLFTIALLKEVRRADVVYAENGPSVEIPAGLVMRLVERPLVLHWGDAAAHEYARKHFWRRLIEQIVTSCAQVVLSDRPHNRPEIIPFESRPTLELEKYEASWTAHMKTLDEIIRHG